MNYQELFDRIFGANGNDGKPLFNANDRQLGSFIYEVAREEFQPEQYENDLNESDESDQNGDDDTASDGSFEEKIEATKKNLDRIVELFKTTRNGKAEFLKNFEEWSPICQEHIKVLREIAEAIHSDKFRTDVVKLVGVAAAAVGSLLCALSFFTPLAPVSASLSLYGGIACGAGGLTTLASKGAQLALLKKRLAKAKEIIKDHEEKFSLMAKWFTVPDELKSILTSVVSIEVLKEISEDLKQFFAEVQQKSNMTIGDFKIRFKEALKLCMKKITKSGKVTSEFGSVLSPIVVTFVFVACIFKSKHRVILDCILINQSLALSLVSILNLAVPASQLANGLAGGAGDNVYKATFMKVLVAFNVVVDVLSLVFASIEVCKCPEPEHTKKLKEAANQLQKMFLAIKDVHDETKKFENHAPVEWITVIVNSVPKDAGKEDIKKAVRCHLPDKAWYCIKLQKLRTVGNNWYIDVPSSQSEQLLRQSHLIIKEETCSLTK